MVIRPLIFRFPTPEPPPDEVGYLTLTRDVFFPANAVTFNAEQHVGVGWDGTIGENKVEIKDDLKSGETGNLFIETGQRWDRDREWKPSGLMLSVEQADIYLVVGHTRTQSVVFGFHPPALLEFVKKCPRTETHAGANGNRPGHYSRGRLVPFRGEDGAALVKFCLAIAS